MRYLTDVVDVAGGQHHTLALKSDGTAYTWGGNGFGQLGIHNNDDHTIPYQVHGPDNVGYLTGIGPICSTPPPGGSAPPPTGNPPTWRDTVLQELLLRSNAGPQ